MNLLLFGDDDRIGADRIRLTDHRLQHLREVIDATEGDSLRVGEINGRMGEAELVMLAQDEALLDVALVLALLAAVAPAPQLIGSV